jgi:hypothetical protein
LGPDAAKLLAAPISAPIVEEIAKAVGVLVIFRLLRPEFHNVHDGIVYGALVGVGFNWFEIALYVAQGYAEKGVPPFALQLGWRFALFGLGGHAMSTGIFGAFLGIALRTRRRWVRILAPIAGLVLAIAAHMLNNALPLLASLATGSAAEPPPAPDAPDFAPNLGFLDAFVSGSLLELTIFLPFILITALALWRSSARERQVIREEMAGEIGRTVSAGEYQEIVTDGILRTPRIDPMRSRASAALVNARTSLRFASVACGMKGATPTATSSRWHGGKRSGACERRSSRRAQPHSRHQFNAMRKPMKMLRARPPPGAIAAKASGAAACAACAAVRAGRAARARLRAQFPARAAR